MKKLFFIACFIAYVNSAAPLFPSQADSSAEQLVRIMMSDAEYELLIILQRKGILTIIKTFITLQHNIQNC